MIKSNKNIKIYNLKAKIINVLMISGKKSTGEKILLKSVKKLQKLSTKHFKTLIQMAIINSTSTFKLNEQIVKKGKRKTVRSIPSFVATDQFRIMLSLKLIKDAARKGKGSNEFYESLSNEIIMASSLRGQSINVKTDLQKQILANKRYLAKFHW
jgi:small subunit ribosomal protein S7